MPAPEGICGLQPRYLIHQSRQFVRTNSSVFVPIVPFSKFMKTQCSHDFNAALHGGKGRHCSLSSLRGRRAGHGSLQKWHNGHIRPALNLEGGLEKYLT